MTQNQEEEKQTFFPAIGLIAEKAHAQDAQQPTDDEDDRPVQEIESLCMNCHRQGVTRMLLASIPYFREIIVMSFRCEHCGFENNEIQSAGIIRHEGVAYTVRVLARKDLDRQLVKSETCTTSIPELELTIPPSKGQLTTIEGLLRDVLHDLNMDQPLRRIQDGAAYEKIEALLGKIRIILADDDEETGDDDGSKTQTNASEKDVRITPFTVKLDDPSGNSFLEFIESTADPKWNMRTYHRTKEQNMKLGLAQPDSEETGVDAIEIPGELEGENDEIYAFPGQCSSCAQPLTTYMKKVNIPYFKDILIMSTNCDRCGYRDNEVKSGSAISEKGKRITLKVEDQEDLSRDILKSESCGLAIPEIDLVLHAGTLGGRFTTLEGILEQVYEELSEKVFAGDSGSNDRKAFETFLKNLKEVKNAERPFTLVLEDPLANSYLQNLYAPDADPNMTIEEYERTWEQNEELGLNDMNVGDYEQETERKCKHANGNSFEA
ncbi:zf-ZPR1-domain-containing protein [Vararia minispora EC-137]|uniref:Zf-ZPR1-domain-containing protein n=1 Tax=Vararia minispora EC-137 TaxID=1314806 RepID=A0ACB8Q9E7_9AGAM|nr:zf-ZPR1-domain-containing protein [Vararia minispora EC-137]